VVALLTIGVERVVTVIMLLMLYSSSTKTKTKKHQVGARKAIPFTNVGLGTMAIVFAIIAFISPILVSEISPNMLHIAISVKCSMVLLE
jgi:hypothetical protein